jgi:hypothetical protein
MKHLKRYNENLKSESVSKLMNSLRVFLGKEGVYTKYLVRLDIISKYLQISLDIPSGFPRGKTDKDYIRNILRKNGFLYIGDSYVKEIENEEDKYIIKEFIDKYQR